MAEQKFQIGDKVIHKAENPSSRTIEMTVHGFVNPNNSSTGILTTGTDWALCQWFNSLNFSYQQTRFHINELEKIS